MVKKLTITTIGIVALLSLMNKIHFHDLADRLYPLLSKVLPLEKNMIESYKHQKLLEKYQDHYKRIDQLDYLFLGDSHIQYFNESTYFPHGNIVNYGISGDTTEGVLNRLPDAQTKNKVKKGVLFMIGYNDLKYKGASAIIRNHRNLVIAASKKFNIPFSKIILHSLFPVSKERIYINSNITHINQAAKSLCTELGCVFLDLHAHFADSEGGLQARYSRDGVHLNQNGYDVWAALLKQSLDI